jgi:1-deoxyxylulose-5-phosphate synthase
METLALKHTGLRVSRLGFGTMTFGSQADDAASARMVDYAMDHGINFFDTANMYNKGVAEEILGKALKGKRDRVILASKVRFKMGDAPDQQGLSRAAMLRAIDESLKRLGTDYLDLYYLHMPDWDTPIEETLATMDELVRQGKVRYPASSNYAGWQVVQMLWIAEKNSYQPAWITQPMYNLIARGIEQEYLPMCKEFGVSTFVYNPLAGGLLTGKQKQAAPVPGTRFDNNKMYLDRYWHMQDFEAVEELRQVAEKNGRSLISLALNWVLHHTAADGMILGASRLEQLEENLTGLGDGPLSNEALVACDEIWTRLKGITPKYNR